MVHNGVLMLFSLAMWVGVFAACYLHSPWASAIEFFCLPEARACARGSPSRLRTR